MAHRIRSPWPIHAWRADWDRQRHVCHDGCARLPFGRSCRSRGCHERGECGAQRVLFVLREVDLVGSAVQLETHSDALFVYLGAAEVRVVGDDSSLRHAGLPSLTPDPTERLAFDGCLMHDKVPQSLDQSVNRDGAAGRSPREAKRTFDSVPGKSRGHKDVTRLVTLAGAG